MPSERFQPDPETAIDAVTLTIKAKVRCHKGDRQLRAINVHSQPCKVNLQVYLFIGIVELLCYEQPSTPP
jgi:hypothetical protein